MQQTETENLMDASHAIQLAYTSTALERRTVCPVVLCVVCCSARDVDLISDGDVALPQALRRKIELTTDATVTIAAAGSAGASALSPTHGNRSKAQAIDSAFVSPDRMDVLQTIGTASRNSLLEAFQNLPDSVLRRLLASADRDAQITDNLNAAVQVMVLQEKKKKTAATSASTSSTAVSVSTESGTNLLPARADNKSIPYQLWTAIFQYLDVGTLWFGCLVVSRAWRRAVYDPTSWRVVSWAPTDDGLGPPERFGAYAPIRKYASASASGSASGSGSRRSSSCMNWEGFFNLSKSAAANSPTTPMAYVSRWFGAWAKVERLELPPRCAPEIIQYYLTHCKQVRQFGLMHNVLYSQPHYAAIGNAEMASKLLTLVISGRGIRDPELALICKNCTGLRQLTLLHQARYLTDASPIKQLKNLEKLELYLLRDISDQHITDFSTYTHSPPCFDLHLCVTLTLL